MSDFRTISGIILNEYKCVHLYANNEKKNGHDWILKITEFPRGIKKIKNLFELLEKYPRIDTLMLNPKKFSLLQLKAFEKAWVENATIKNCIVSTIGSSIEKKDSFVKLLDVVLSRQLLSLKLIDIDIDKCIEDRICDYIDKNPDLKGFGFKHCKYQKTLFNVISSMDNLTHLEMIGTDKSGSKDVLSGLANYITDLSKITHLDIQEIYLSSENCTAITDVIKKCKSLKVLSLAMYGWWTLETITCLGDALIQNSTLEELELRGSTVPCSVIKLLYGNLKRLNLKKCSLKSAQLSELALVVSHKTEPFILNLDDNYATLDDINLFNLVRDLNPGVEVKIPSTTITPMPSLTRLM